MEKIDPIEENRIEFVCEKCGECCRHITAFVHLWPYQNNGVCLYLNGNNCSIYNSRPDFCNFNRAYSYCRDKMSKLEYVRQTIQNCDLLKEMASKR